VGESPRAWIIRGEAWQRMDAFVATLDSGLWDRFSFALTQCDSRPCVVLAIRPSAESLADVRPPGEPYRQFPKLPNLYLPLGLRIDPPLRRETLRRLLSPDPAVVNFLSANTEGLHIETIAESAFQPLTAWIDCVLDRDRES